MLFCRFSRLRCLTPLLNTCPSSSVPWFCLSRASCFPWHRQRMTALLMADHFSSSMVLSLISRGPKWTTTAAVRWTGKTSNLSAGYSLHGQMGTFSKFQPKKCKRTASGGSWRNFSRFCSSTLSSDQERRWKGQEILLAQSCHFCWLLGSGCWCRYHWRWYRWKQYAFGSQRLDLKRWPWTIRAARNPAAFLNKRFGGHVL